MPHIGSYVCDICGESYNNEEAAALCEKNHSVPISVLNPVYYPPRRYPDEVIVEMADGCAMIFHSVNHRVYDSVEKARENYDCRRI